MRVEIAVARLRGRRCAYLAAGGRLGRPGACGRPTFLAASGSARFSFAASLPRGRYRVLVRATDAAGNRSVARRIAVPPATSLPRSA